MFAFFFSRYVASLLDYAHKIMPQIVCLFLKCSYNKFQISLIFFFFYTKPSHHNKQLIKYFPSIHYLVGRFFKQTIIFEKNNVGVFWLGCVCVCLVC